MVVVIIIEEITTDQMTTIMGGGDLDTMIHIHQKIIQKRSTQSPRHQDFMKV